MFTPSLKSAREIALLDLQQINGQRQTERERKREKERKIDGQKEKERVIFINDHQSWQQPSRLIAPLLLDLIKNGSIRCHK